MKNRIVILILVILVVPFFFVGFNINSWHNSNVDSTITSQVYISDYAPRSLSYEVIELREEIAKLKDRVTTLELESIDRELKIKGNKPYEKQGKK